MAAPLIQIPLALLLENLNLFEKRDQMTQVVLLTTNLAWIYATLVTAITFYFFGLSYTYFAIGGTIGICGILGIFLIPPQALKMKFPINKKEKEAG